MSSGCENGGSVPVKVPRSSIRDAEAPAVTRRATRRAIAQKMASVEGKSPKPARTSADSLVPLDPHGHGDTIGGSCKGEPKSSNNSLDRCGNEHNEDEKIKKQDAGNSITAQEPESMLETELPPSEKTVSPANNNLLDPENRDTKTVLGSCKEIEDTGHTKVPAEDTGTGSGHFGIDAPVHDTYASPSFKESSEAQEQDDTAHEGQFPTASEEDSVKSRTKLDDRASDAKLDERSLITHEGAFPSDHVNEAVTSADGQNEKQERSPTTNGEYASSPSFEQEEVNEDLRSASDGSIGQVEEDVIIHDEDPPKDSGLPAEGAPNVSSGEEDDRMEHEKTLSNASKEDESDATECRKDEDTIHFTEVGEEDEHGDEEHDLELKPQEVQDDSEEDGDNILVNSKGMAANLVSTIRSFLPLSKAAATSPHGKALTSKPAKVKALEAAELARRKEEEKAVERRKQKLEMEKARQERLKTKAAAEAEEAKRREQARRRKEEEALQRRRDREMAEKREREEKAKRFEEARQRAAVVAAASAVSREHRPPNLSAYGNRPHPAAVTSADQSLEAAKQRLAKIQQQAALIHKQAGEGNKPLDLMHRHAQPSSSTIPSDVERSQKAPPNRMPSPPPPSAIPNPSRLATNASAIKGKDIVLDASNGNGTQHGAEQSYEISPYRSDFESDEDDAPKKPVPDWARGKALVSQLMAQMYIDPDEVFQQHAKTCSLDEVFAGLDRKNGRQDFSRRSSSGNWFEDRVTWKEELAYKKAMGYV